MAVWAIWIGAAIAALGGVGVIAAAITAMRARATLREEPDLRAALNRAMAWNLGAFLIAAIGLMTVVLGIILR